MVYSGPLNLEMIIGWSFINYYEMNLARISYHGYDVIYNDFVVHYFNLKYFITAIAEIALSESYLLLVTGSKTIRH